VVQTHGYDSDDFDTSLFPDSSIEKKPIKEKSLSQNEPIRILYSGTFYADSGPGIFLRAVNKLIKEVPSLANILELHFQGSPMEPYLQLINQLGLGEIVHDHGYVPHNVAILRMQQASILWLNNGHRKRKHTITLSKTYEYMATRRPIIALIPEGDTKKVLKDYSRSYITSPDDIEKVKKTILQSIADVQKGNLKPLNEQWLETFTRKAIAESLANKLDSLLDQHPVN
jgi:glycosyltransferase involved in cell wall biosynthesis